MHFSVFYELIEAVSSITITLPISTFLLFREDSCDKKSECNVRCICHDYAPSIRDI